MEGGREGRGGGVGRGGRGELKNCDHIFASEEHREHLQNCVCIIYIYTTLTQGMEGTLYTLTWMEGGHCRLWQCPCTGQ